MGALSGMVGVNISLDEEINNQSLPAAQAKFKKNETEQNLPLQIRECLFLSLT